MTATPPCSNPRCALCAPLFIPPFIDQTGQTRPTARELLAAMRQEGEE